MLQYPANRQLDQQTLRKLLIALMIRQQQQQQQQGQAPQQEKPSSLDEVLATINKGKRYYDQGKAVYDAISSLSSSGSTPTYSPQTQAEWNKAADAASGISNSSQAPGESSFSWGDAVPYVNAAISAYNAYKLLKDKDMPEGQRNLALGGAAAQASTPWTGGWGTAAAGALNAGAALKGKGTEEEKTQAAAHQAGMAVANYWTAGLAGLADNFARKQWGGTMKKVDKFRFNTPGTPEWALMKVAGIWDTDKWKTEGNRLKGLIDKGVNIPENYQLPMKLTRGRSKDQLINKNYANDFVGQTKEGFVNNKFANSRNEADLRPEDIWGYAGMFERYGNDWLGKFNEQQRRDIAQKALSSGAVREHHGTIDIDWNKVQGVPSATAIPVQKPVQPAVQTPNTQVQTVNKTMGNKIPRK